MICPSESHCGRLIMNKGASVRKGGGARQAAEGANPEGSGSALGPAVAKRARANDSLENSGPAAVETERDDTAPRRGTYVGDTREEPVSDGAGADGAEGVELAVLQHVPQWDSRPSWRVREPRTAHSQSRLRGARCSELIGKPSERNILSRCGQEEIRESGSLSLEQHGHGRSAIVEQVAGPQARVSFVGGCAPDAVSAHVHLNALTTLCVRLSVGKLMGAITDRY